MIILLLLLLQYNDNNSKKVLTIAKVAYDVNFLLNLIP